MPCKCSLTRPTLALTTKCFVPNQTESQSSVLGTEAVSVGLTKLKSQALTSYVPWVNTTHKPRLPTFAVAADLMSAILTQEVVFFLQQNIF